MLVSFSFKNFSEKLFSALKFVLSSDVTIKFNGQTSSANILGPGSVDGLNWIWNDFLFKKIFKAM